MWLPGRCWRTQPASFPQYPCDTEAKTRDWLTAMEHLSCRVMKCIRWIYFQSSVTASFNPIIMCLSPGQLFSHRVIWTGDKSGRVCARGVCLRRHGKCPQTDSPQQVEHKHTQQHRLGGEKAGEERRWTPADTTDTTCSKRSKARRGGQHAWTSDGNAHSPQSKLSRIHLAVSQHWAAQCASPEATYSKHTIIAAMLYGDNC